VARGRHSEPRPRGRRRGGGGGTGDPAGGRIATTDEATEEEVGRAEAGSTPDRARERAPGQDDGGPADDATSAAPGSEPAGPEPRRGAPAGRSPGLLAIAGVAVLAAALVGGLTLLLAPDAEPERAARTGAAAAAGPAQDALLLVRTAPEGGAAGMTLLAVEPDSGRALVLLLPVGTLADIPGVGLDRLGLAQQYGGTALAQATVENLLGITVDAVASVDDAGLGAILDRAGGQTLTVPARLVRRADDGTAEVRFEAGEQHLDGPRLAEYWGFVARGEDELAAFSRQQQVLGGLLAALGDPEVLDAVAPDGVPQLDTGAEPAWIRQLLAGLAGASAEGELQVTLLPVEAFGGQGPDGSSTFRPRSEAITALVRDSLAGSVPPEGAGGPVRVQVLNGVGVPGVGQLVDRRLGGGAFRIVLSDNARDFDFTETRILVYDESPRSMEAAQRVRERLGVGTIQVSRQPQSVVDLTIVVGADFLQTEPAAEPPAGAGPAEDPEQE
jgi:polyisoprenyl-teichoic acid--peptidoglycan teichoic acid transferase